MTVSVDARGEQDRPSSPRSSARSLLRLWPYIRPHRSALSLAAVFTLLAMLSGIIVPLILQRILDGPVAHRDAGSLPVLVGLMLVIGLAEGACLYLRRKLVARPTAQLEVDIRNDFYAHLQRLPVEFHDRWQSGQLLSRAVSDLSQLRRFIAFGVIFLLVNSLTLALGIAVIFVLSPMLGLITLATCAPLMLISARFEARYKTLARTAQDQRGDLATIVEESAQGIRVLKAFGRGPFIGRRFLAEANRLRDTELAKARAVAVLWGAIMSLPEVGIGLQLAFGGFGIARGTISIGTVVAAITIATYLRWPIDVLGWLLAETNACASACDRVWEVFDTAPSIVDPPRARTLAEPVRGALRFERVSFRYPGTEADTLCELDLSIQPGETVALVGATGSGKTTMTALVPRLMDPTGGRITIDDVDIATLPLAELRGTVAMAFEDPVLFSASVRENVGLGAVPLDDTSVHRALLVASAAEFVTELPWGIDTRIGEQGHSLSGGQRQRLALARAVAAAPRILILDDPLSALDVHTEAEIEAALRSVLRGVTALVVAHRASTVLLADRVALLSRGRIAAVGTHSHLLDTNSEYRDLLSTMDDHQHRDRERSSSVASGEGAR
ncbi:MAG: ABC transporter ATP-binding protein [Sciscionella sp.]